jgi:hypothetical protein
MSDRLTPKEIDLLQSGLTKPTPVFHDDYEVADGLRQRGLATLTGLRSIKLKTTGDGAVALSQSREKPRPSFKGITASECNAWLTTLPPVPLHGEGDA